MKTKTLLLSLLVPMSALADTGIRVVRLTGLGALTGPEFVSAYGIASTKLSEGLRPISLRKVRTMEDPCASENRLGNFANQYGCYERLALGLRRFRYGQTLVVGPPMSHTDGQRYLGGTARRDCFRHISRRVAWVAATGATVTGTPRIYSSGIVMAHEVGHTFGATHTPVVSVMHADALSYARDNTPLSFTQASTNEMLQCRNDGGL